MACRTHPRGLAGLERHPLQPHPEGRGHSQLDNHLVYGTRLSARRPKPSLWKKPMPPRHRFLEPIHNVKEGQQPHASARQSARRSGLHTWRIKRGAMRRWPTLQRRRISCANSSPLPRWWSQSGSNRRPQACKASALPTELWPLIDLAHTLPTSHREWWAWEDLNFRPHAYQARALTN